MITEPTSGMELDRWNSAPLEGWSLIADVDESAPYEVDQTRIYSLEDGRFVLATASGCSCWDGEWETQTFSSLDEIENAVLYREKYAYNPSLEGAKTLVEQAKSALSLSH